MSKLITAITKTFREKRTQKTRRTDAVLIQIHLLNFALCLIFREVSKKYHV